MKSRVKNSDSSNDEPCILNLGTYHVLVSVLERLHYESVSRTEKFGDEVDFDRLTALCQFVLSQQCPGYTGRLVVGYVTALWYMIPALEDCRQDALRLARALQEEFRVWR